MTNLILWALAAIGMTDIAVSSSVAKPMREFLKKQSPVFGEMLTCHQCTGFWCGIIAGLLLGFTYVPGIGLLAYLVLFGFASSFLAPLGKSILEALFGTLTLPDDFGPITQERIQELNEATGSHLI